MTVARVPLDVAVQMMIFRGEITAAQLADQLTMCFNGLFASPSPV